MFRETSRHFVLFGGDTVDGRNPAPVDISSLSHIPLFTRFFSSQVVLAGCISIVGWYPCWCLIPIMNLPERHGNPPNEEPEEKHVKK